MTQPEAVPVPACPKCGSPDVVPIVFGYPTPETAEKADRGEVYLGGCMVPSSGQWADHACRACGHEWAHGPYPWGKPKTRKPSGRRRAER